MQVKWGLKPAKSGKRDPTTSTFMPAKKRSRNDRLLATVQALHLSQLSQISQLGLLLPQLVMLPQSEPNNPSTSVEVASTLDSAQPAPTELIGRFLSEHLEGTTEGAAGAFDEEMNNRDCFDDSAGSGTGSVNTAPFLDEGSFDESAVSEHEVGSPESELLVGACMEDLFDSGEELKVALDESNDRSNDEDIDFLDPAEWLELELEASNLSPAGSGDSMAELAEMAESMEEGQCQSKAEQHLQQLLRPAAREAAAAPLQQQQQQLLQLQQLQQLQQLHLRQLQQLQHTRPPKRKPRGSSKSGEGKQQRARRPIIWQCLKVIPKGGSITS